MSVQIVSDDDDVDEVEEVKENVITRTLEVVRRLIMGLDPGYRHLSNAWYDPVLKKVTMHNNDLHVIQGRLYEIEDKRTRTYREIIYGLVKSWDAYLKVTRAVFIEDQIVPISKNPKAAVTMKLTFEVMIIFEQCFRLLYPHLHVFFANPRKVRNEFGISTGSHKTNKEMSVTFFNQMVKSDQDRARLKQGLSKGKKIKEDPIEASLIAIYGSLYLDEFMKPPPELKPKNKKTNYKRKLEATVTVDETFRFPKQVKQSKKKKKKETEEEEEEEGVSKKKRKAPSTKKSSKKQPKLDLISDCDSDDAISVRTCSDDDDDDESTDLSCGISEEDDEASIRNVKRFRPKKEGFIVESSDDDSVSIPEEEEAVEDVESTESDSIVIDDDDDPNPKITNPEPLSLLQVVSLSSSPPDEPLVA